MTPRGPRLAAAAVIGACAALAACSLTSLSGFAGPPEEEERLAADATPDAPALAETSVDGADAAAQRPFCETITPTPTFCDDFERTMPKGAWSNLLASGGGGLTTEPSTRDRGRELRSFIPVYTGGGVSAAEVQVYLAPADVVTVSYALRIEAAPQQGAQQIMAFLVNGLQPSSDFFVAYVMVRQDGVTLVEQTFPGGQSSAYAEHPLLAPITFGEWHRVELAATLSAPPHLQLIVDGKTAYDANANAFFRRGNVTVMAGVHYTDAPSGPLAVRVDDLFVRVK